VSGPNNSFTERFITSGADFRLNYQLSPRDAVGGSVTPIYILGLTPSGHELAETIQATYQRQLTSTLAVRAGAGPLFIQSSSSLYGSAQNTSYAINASIIRQIRQSQFQLSYSRAFIVNFLTPAILSDAVGFNAYLPLKRRWIFVGTASYTHDSGDQQYGSATIYGGSAQIAYQVGSKMQLFAQYSLLSEDFNREVLLQAFDYTRNKFGGGIRFNLGNPITRGGVQ
jgi:hypothetical protein